MFNFNHLTTYATYSTTLTDASFQQVHLIQSLPDVTKVTINIEYLMLK